MQNGNRIRHIADLSSFGILLVVFGHSFATLDAAGSRAVSAFCFLHSLVYSFHMPLFFFISGYLFMHTNPPGKTLSYTAFVRRKIVRLLLPYVAISTAAFPVKVALSKYAWRGAHLGPADYLKSLVFPLDNTIFFFWFLPTIFIIFLAAPLMRKVLDSRAQLPAAAAATITFAALNILVPVKSVPLLNLSGVAHHLVFFWLGCVMYRFGRKYNGPPALALAAVLFAATTALSAFGADYVEAFLAAVCGILGSFYLISFTAARSGGAAPLVFRPIDGYSYQIYLLSWFFQSLFRILLFQMLKLGFFPAFAGMFLGGLFGPIIVVKIVEKFIPRAGVVIGLRS